MDSRDSGKPGSSLRPTISLDEGVEDRQDRRHDTPLHCFELLQHTTTKQSIKSSESQHAMRGRAGHPAWVRSTGLHLPSRNGSEAKMVEASASLRDQHQEADGSQPFLAIAGCGSSDLRSTAAAVTWQPQDPRVPRPQTRQCLWLHGAGMGKGPLGARWQRRRPRAPAAPAAKH